MRKNILFGVFAAATMLLATSCQKEEEPGSEVMVSFALNQPGIATKAYSDGLTATTLTYAVYEADSKTPLITSENEVTFNAQKQAVVNLRLVTGMSYDIIFWADVAQNSPYTFSAENQTITVDYTNVTSQDENRDAFFAAEKSLYVDGAIDKTITLRRPFAQLNIGTTDSVKADSAGFNPTQSSVTVSNIYSTLNLLSGEASDEKPVTFAMAAIPDAAGEQFPVNGAKYLSMNYLLMSTDNELVTVDFTVTDGSHSITRQYSNVPVHRNYRTNIYGKLLTDPIKYDVVIDEGYDNPDLDMNNVIYVSDQEALNTASIVDGSVVILGTGTYTIPSSAHDKTLMFVGAGDAANTVIECKEVGNGNLYNSTVTFENLTIETDNATYRGFQHIAGATYRDCIIENCLTLYTDGTPIEFENCVFNTTGDGYNLWTWGASAIFSDCTFNCDGKSALVYGGGVSTVTFNACTFNDNGGIDGKAAIETGNDYDATYTININTCTVNGFDVNSVSGSNVWGNKNSMTADKLDVFIDGTEVY